MKRLNQRLCYITFSKTGICGPLLESIFQGAEGKYAMPCRLLRFTRISFVVVTELLNGMIYEEAENHRHPGVTGKTKS